MYGLVIQLRALFSASIVSIVVCFSPAGNALVISQIYGGGGNSGSLFTNDFIEIFNNSPSVADLSSFSVQYASHSATTWHKTDLSDTLDPYHYYLIQEAGGSNGTTPLPTPDKIDTIGLSASSGNIALVSTQSLLPSANACLDASILDLVGYGSAVCYEGSAATPGLSNTNSAVRLAGGLTDSNDNSLDFALLLPPLPRNTASSANIPVSGAPVLAVNSVSEPASIALLAGGLAVMLLRRQRQAKARAVIRDSI
jgi:predicted extracellular nuclease